MKGWMSLLARLVTLAGLCAVARAESAPLQFEVEGRPAEPLQWRSLTARAEYALRRYAQACEGGAPAPERLFTASAVIEYPAQSAGRFDSFSVVGDGHCWRGLPGREAAGTPRIHIYPATEPQTLFVEYSIPHAGGWSRGIAFIEMQGERITRIRDLTATP